MSINAKESTKPKCPSPLNQTDGAVKFIFPSVKRKNDDNLHSSVKKTRKMNGSDYLKEQILEYLSVGNMIDSCIFEELDEIMSIILSFNNGEEMECSPVPETYEDFPYSNALYENVKIWCKKAKKYDGLYEWAIDKGNQLKDAHLNLLF